MGKVFPKFKKPFRLSLQFVIGLGFYYEKSFDEPCANWLGVGAVLLISLRYD